MNVRWVAGLALALAAPRPAALGVPLDVGRGERLVVVAPHPDDETLAAGGLIHRVAGAGGSVVELLVTAGDGYVRAVRRETGFAEPDAEVYEGFGERRIQEARRALDRLAGDRGRLELLGFPDGGLEDLIDRHWRELERSPTTGVIRPPYPESIRAATAYSGEALLAAITFVLREARPTMVAIPDPLDRHPDHAAAGRIALLALDELHRRHGQKPRVLAYLVHWPDWPPGWNDRPPVRRPLAAPLELPAGLASQGLTRVSFALSLADLEAKVSALAEHRTQLTVDGTALTAFERGNEPFTVFDAAAIRAAANALRDQITRRPNVPHAEAKR